MQVEMGKWRRTAKRWFCFVLRYWPAAVRLGDAGSERSGECSRMQGWGWGLVYFLASDQRVEVKVTV